MRAAVVDVGSNSIKLLVADRGSGGHLTEVVSRTLEVRIGTGIGSGTGQLTLEGTQRGLAAISELVLEARGLKSDLFAAVATSAVRDASNGPEFCERVKAATGLDLRILTGAQEAEGIGHGLMTDPALLGMRDFSVYDLGGGSLECLSFRDRKVERAVSLPLGCVRLKEMFVRAPEAPLGAEVASAISGHVKEVLLKSGFPLPPEPAFGVVGTGGTLTSVRSILAARSGVSFPRSDAVVKVSSLREMLTLTGAMDADARKAVPGLPASRADVFPTALVTLLALADLGAIQAFQHSLRNLRWGLAAGLLDRT